MARKRGVTISITVPAEVGAAIEDKHWELRVSRSALVSDIVIKHFKEVYGLVLDEQPEEA